MWFDSSEKTMISYAIDIGWFSFYVGEKSEVNKHEI